MHSHEISISNWYRQVFLIETHRKTVTQNCLEIWQPGEILKFADCPPFTYWKEPIQFIFLSKCIQSFYICQSAGVLMCLPEHHPLQEYLFNHPLPGQRPTGMLTPLCESGAECKLNLLHTHNGTFLEHGCLDHFLHTVAQGSFYGMITGTLKLWIVASSMVSLPKSDSGALSGLPQIRMAINVPIQISFKVSFLAAEVFYLSPVLSLQRERT